MFVSLQQWSPCLKGQGIATYQHEVQGSNKDAYLPVAGIKKREIVPVILLDCRGLVNETGIFIQLWMNMRIFRKS